MVALAIAIDTLVNAAVLATVVPIADGDSHVRPARYTALFTDNWLSCLPYAYSALLENTAELAAS